MRNRIDPEVAAAMEGKMMTEADVSVKLIGPSRVIGPELVEETYPILHALKGTYTSNRGYAAGTPTRAVSNPEWKTATGVRKRSYAKKVDSAIIGAWEASGPKQYCRLTAWSGREVEQWRGLWPLFERIATCLKEQVPERYAAQARVAERTSPDWVIPGTPFTTITEQQHLPDGRAHRQGRPRDRLLDAHRVPPGRVQRRLALHAAVPARRGHAGRRPVVDGRPPVARQHPVRSDASLQ